MSKRQRNYGFLTLAMLLLSSLLMPSLTQTAFADNGTYNVTLHEPHQGATIPGFPNVEDDCPAGPTQWVLHFVAPPSGDIQNMNVYFTPNGGTQLHITDFYSHPNDQHAYVYVPGPGTLDNANADIADGTNANKLVLSHICYPDTEPTLHPAGVIKYHDANSNANEDSGEPRLSGWVFNWTSTDGQSGQLTTGADGTAQTADIFEAGVTVQFTEVVQTGWFVTTNNPANATVISDGVAKAKFGNNFDTTTEGNLTGDGKCENGNLTNTFDREVNVNIFIDDSLIYEGNIGIGNTPITYSFIGDNAPHTIKVEWQNPNDGLWHELSWAVKDCGDESEDAPAEWKWNLLKYAQFTPAPGVFVINGFGIVGGWDWMPAGNNWEDAYLSQYRQILLIDGKSTALEMYFWPYGDQNCGIKLLVHESNKWEHDPTMLTIAAYDRKSLEVGFPAGYQPPAEPNWWQEIDWSAPNGHHWANFGPIHQSGLWPQLESCEAGPEEVPVETFIPTTPAAAPVITATIKITETAAISPTVENIPVDEKVVMPEVITKTVYVEIQTSHHTTTTIQLPAPPAERIVETQIIYIQIQPNYIGYYLPVSVMILFIWMAIMWIIRRRRNR